MQRVGLISGRRTPEDLSWAVQLWDVEFAWNDGRVPPIQICGIAAAKTAFVRSDPLVRWLEKMRAGLLNCWTDRLPVSPGLPMQEGSFGQIQSVGRGQHKPARHNTDAELGSLAVVGSVAIGGGLDPTAADHVRWSHEEPWREGELPACRGVVKRRQEAP